MPHGAVDPASHRVAGESDWDATENAVAVANGVHVVPVVAKPAEAASAPAAWPPIWAAALRAVAQTECAASRQECDDGDTCTSDARVDHRCKPTPAAGL